MAFKKYHKIKQKVSSSTYPCPQVLNVDIAQVVGRSADIFTVMNPQFGQQHHQLVIITHLRKKSNSQI